MKVLFFGALADAIGVPAYELNETQDINELRKKIFTAHPQLAGKTFVIAVNKKVQTGNVTLNDTDEVALLPPFSGG